MKNIVLHAIQANHSIHEYNHTIHEFNRFYKKKGTSAECSLTAAGKMQITNKCMECNEALWRLKMHHERSVQEFDKCERHCSWRWQFFLWSFSIFYLTGEEMQVWVVLDYVAWFLGARVVEEAGLCDGPDCVHNSAIYCGLVQRSCQNKLRYIW